MKLHNYPDEFQELVAVTAEEKHIPESAVRRDYYIVRNSYTQTKSRISKPQPRYFKKLTHGCGKSENKTAKNHPMSKETWGDLSAVLNVVLSGFSAYSAEII